ncbi:MAG: hypothetical protein ACRC1H_02660 [Caldilineaceae bacterium]
MTLIEGGFAGWWKKYSAIALFLIAALQSAWAASPEVQAMLSAQTMSYVTGALAGLGFIGRFIKQTEGLT